MRSSHTVDRIDTAFVRYQQRPIKASGVEAARRPAGTARKDSLADQDEDRGKSALDTATAEG